MISVVIPIKIDTEQGLDWLKEAIQSVLIQEVEKEIIVINDHSEISFDSLRMEYKTEILWVENEGFGLADARNTGVRMSKGDMFFPLDADDRLAEKALITALNRFDGKGFLYGSTMMFDDHGQYLYKSKPYDFNLLLKQVYWVKLNNLSSMNYNVSSTRLLCSRCTWRGKCKGRTDAR